MEDQTVMEDQTCGSGSAEARPAGRVPAREGPWTLRERGTMIVRLGALVQLGHDAALPAFTAARGRRPSKPFLEFQQSMWAHQYGVRIE